MEKVCEFCRGVRPVVYCQADAAHLCLSCDAKVHSANALSNRHLRSLLCDSCRFRPASFHCPDHNIYTCRSCDKALHSSLQQHQRQPINSYIGCPSAKDFAALWDLDLNELREGGTPSNNNAASSSIMSCTTSVRLGIPHAGSTKQQQQKTTSKISGKRQQLQATRFIMQQIADLKKLQLNDQGNGNGNGNGNGDGDGDGSNQQLYSSPLVHGKEDNTMSSSSLSNVGGGSLRKIEETTSDGNQDTDIHPNGNNLLEKINGKPFPSTFTLESLPSSIDAESFWQCRSPFLTNQFSAQNMQDLGVCEDLSGSDFNIPDVDLTFQNYEELFGGEQGLASRGSLDDNHDIMSCSSDKSIGRAIQDATASAAASSLYISSMRSDHFGLSSQSVDIARSTACPIQPSYSSLSISQDHDEDAAGGGGAFTLNARGDATKRYKDKKKSRLYDSTNGSRHENKTQHALTSSSSSVENADVRKREVVGEVRMQRFRYR